MSKNDLFDLKSILTPSFLAIVVVMLANVISLYIGLCPIWIALALSFLFSLLMVIVCSGRARVNRAKQLKYFISYGIVIFVMAVGSNHIGDKISVSIDRKLMDYYPAQVKYSATTNISMPIEHRFFRDWFAK